MLFWWWQESDQLLQTIHLFNKHRLFLLDKALPGTRPRGCASGKKWKLSTGTNTFWELRGWQLVLPLLLHVPLIYCGVKKITPKLSGLKQNPGFCGSGIQGGLGRCFQFKSLMQLQSESGWKSEGLDQPGVGRTLLSPHSLKVSLCLSMWMSLGFRTAWQPQSVWIAYVVAPPAWASQGIKMNMWGIFMTYPWKPHSVPLPYTLSRPSQGPPPRLEERSRSLGPISQWEEKKSHNARRAGGMRDTFVTIFGKYNLPHRTYPLMYTLLFVFLDWL